MKVVESCCALAKARPLLFGYFFFLMPFAPILAQSRWESIEGEISRLVVKENEADGLEIYIETEEGVAYHQAWGWKDRENNVPLEPGMIYNIRSMTKPMIGTLVHIYVDRGLVDLDDPISKYLAAFEGRDLTLREMLLHRGGYVQGMPGKSWTQYPDLESIVNYWGDTGPQHPGNEHWSYADAHADIAGRVLEVISGKSLKTLLQEELFNPLQLENTYAAWSDLVDPGQIMPLYKGTKGSWSCLWRPTDGRFYDFAMGAQSVFSDAADYATYMQSYWLPDRGSLLSRKAIRSTFANRDTIALPPGLFPLADQGSLFYGHFWGMIDFGIKGNSPLPDVFMHQGSDGTAAYAFTEEKVVVVVLTQSRGTAILPKIEALLPEIMETVSR